MKTNWKNIFCYNYSYNCHISYDHDHTWYDQKNNHKQYFILSYFLQDALYKIAKIEGVGALWSGLSPTLVLALPCTVIYFVTYEQLRLKMKKSYNNFTADRK